MKKDGRARGKAEPGRTGFDRVVGRAELKLAEAAKAFGFDFRGKAVLDIGSSTGGFTEYALRAGASRVIAIEKGTRQMKAPLRYDERVELHEKTDFLQIENDEQLVTQIQVGVVLADVSFVSLREILAVAKRVVPREADYLVMCKPQFEARPEQLVNGVVKNERMRREILQWFERWVTKNGFVIVKKRDNETVGKVGGNRERFYWLRAVR